MGIFKEYAEVKIEKNVPIPVRYAKNGRSRWGDALGKMKVGDSFEYTGKSVSNMYIYAKCRGIRIRAHHDEDTGRFRIWRIA